MVLHKQGHKDQTPNASTRPPIPDQVQLRPLGRGEPVSDEDGGAEQRPGPAGGGHIPLGVVRPRVEVAVHPLADGGVEEEEVVVGEEEDEGSAFEEAVEVRGADEGEPQHLGGDGDELLGGGGLPAAVLGEAAEAVGGDGGGEHPRPEDPAPAKVHPEEGRQGGPGGGFGGVGGEEGDGGPFEELEGVREESSDLALDMGFVRSSAGASAA